MLGVIITKVLGARIPEEPEYVLRFPVSQPMESHVHRLGATMLYVICDDTLYC